MRVVFFAVRCILVGVESRLFVFSVDVFTCCWYTDNLQTRCLADRNIILVEIFTVGELCDASLALTANYYE